MNQNLQDKQASAFDLAYFIVPDADKAETVTKNALLKLEVAANAQYKRYYYTPSGRSSGRGGAGRTKITLKEPQLLQRMVYVASNEIEQAQESDQHSCTLHQNDMVIRFIKFLVQATIKRNSFYVNLAMTRLLHEYGTRDAMNLYEVVVQDPERVPDDHYFRSRKKRLIAEIRERFGDLLKVTRGSRGEVRFEAAESAEETLQLVRTSLEKFTPWDSVCALHGHFDPHADEIAGLTYEGDDPDGEHEIEINRMHTVLCPDCFETLIESLSLEDPDMNLSIPLFSLQGGGDHEDGNRDKRLNPPDFSDRHGDRVDQFLDDQAAARKRSPIGELTLKADGREIGTLDLLRENRTQVALPSGGEIVEVYAPGNLLLATFLVDEYSLEEQPQQKALTRLEGGQEVAFEIQLKPSLDDEFGTMEMAVSYRETAPLRRAKLGLARTSAKLAAGFSPRALGAMGTVTAVLLAALLMFNTASPNAADVLMQNNEELRRSLVRDGSSLPAGLSITQVQRIWVEDLGNRVAHRTALISALAESNRFEAAGSITDADAVIKDMSAFVSDHLAEGEWVPALVNAQGETLWATSLKPIDEKALLDQARAVVNALERETLDD